MPIEQAKARGSSTNEDRARDVATGSTHDASNEARCLVVMYHYIRDVAPLPRPGLPSVPPAIPGLTSREFRAQLDRLTASMEPIDWPRLYAWTCGRSSIPDRCFLLTFDDGLKDHVENVLPILQERGLRGTFFIPGSILVSQTLLPAHAIHALLATLDEETLERELIAYLVERDRSAADAVTSVELERARSLYDYESPARARLKYALTMMIPVHLRNAAVEALFRQHIGSPQRWAGHWYVGWEDLTRMQSEGHTVGGHGFSHEPYERLTRAQRRQDAVQVATVLHRGLGPDLRPFSYPYGRFDDDACDACQHAGFAHAFTTESRWITSQDAVLALPRVDTVDVSAALERPTTCRST